MATPHRTAAEPPTLEIVAARAGVSRATASRVLNGSLHVSPGAYEAVTRAADELRYRPNRAARSLVTRRTDSVAFVVTEPDERLFSDPFFATFLRGAHDELTANNVQLVLAFASGGRDRERLERFASGQHVDGIVLISLHGKDPLPLQLEELGVPVVLMGRPLKNAELLYYVDADNTAGASQATRLLLDRGCRRVATIIGPQDMVAGKQRLAGYKAALRSASVTFDPDLVAQGDFTRTGGIQAMQALLEIAPDLDGVFAASDPMAFGALSALRAAGRAVPDDVAVIGFDDAPDAASADPPLTTVRQPIGEMGRQVARLLLARVAGEETERSIVLPTEVVVRSSA